MYRYSKYRPLTKSPRQHVRLRLIGVIVSGEMGFTFTNESFTSFPYLNDVFGCSFYNS